MTPQWLENAFIYRLSQRDIALSAFHGGSFRLARPVLALSSSEAVLHCASFAPTRLSLFTKLAAGIPAFSQLIPSREALHLTGKRAGGFVMGFGVVGV
ncbi:MULTISPECIES: hypothetical protein [Gammaproteobacteria]|uniref:hypothetical protein n=1 Tax=Gammaproteobacteria TaxID=1236 RepID=UPI0011CD7C8E|nr:hypothetical protein [Gallaecimonas pentaromativorans]